jgi:2'-5' RNA ligase
MRIFIALELSGEIKAALARMRGDISGARWVPAEQIHLTLAFLGEVDQATMELLIEKLARIRLPRLELAFSGPGCFPNRHRPRVLWIGVMPVPGLDDLAAAIHEAVLACGIPQDERPFSAHITLARLKLPAASGGTDAFLDQRRKQNLPRLSVGEFTLFQSRLTAQGALHTAIRSFPLT